MPFRSYLFAFVLGLIFLPGCRPATIAHVKVRVTWDGKPVTAAAITFSPVPRFEGDKESGKSATGFSDAEGNYVLSTYKAMDGALVGKHRVTVSSG